MLAEGVDINIVLKEFTHDWQSCQILVAHNIEFDNVDGYLWFPIQGTPRTEPSIRHTDTMYLDIKRQDREREDVYH